MMDTHKVYWFNSYILCFVMSAIASIFENPRIVIEQAAFRTHFSWHPFARQFYLTLTLRGFEERGRDFYALSIYHFKKQLS